MPDWPEVPLSSIASESITYGVVQPGPAGNVPFIRSGDISDGRINVEALRTISESVSQQYHRTTLEGGELLVSLVGNPGALAIVPSSLAGANIARQVALIRLDDDLVSADFLKYYLSSHEGQSRLASREYGSVQRVINLRDLRQIQIPLPPLAVQKRIAAVPRALDDKIELNRKMNRTLEEMGQALFKSWFIDFDGHTDFVESELYPIPRGWTVGALSEIAEITMGQSPPGSTYNQNGDGLPFFQGATDFGDAFPTNRVFCTSPTRLAEEWDVLLSVRAPVGRINLAIERCAIGRGVASLRSKAGSHRAYFWALLTSLQERLYRYNAEGTVFGSINKRSLENLQVVIPSASRVEEFEKLAWPFLAQRRTLTEESRTLADLRNTLLPKLVSGELRVPEAEKLLEAAS